MAVETLNPVEGILPPAKLERSAAQNNKYRAYTDFLDRPVRLFHKAFPGVIANDVSFYGALSYIQGKHDLEELKRQGDLTLDNIVNNKDIRKKVVAGTLRIGIGKLCDVIDGRLAILIRSEMTDEDQKRKNELFGQYIDPALDGLTETIGGLESFYTALKLGHPLAAVAALFKIASSNIPRTTKAYAEAEGVIVDEGHPFWDPRFPGTGFGRTIFDFIGTAVNSYKGVNVQGLTDETVSVANIVVATQRYKAFLNVVEPIDLSDEEKEKREILIENALYRGPKLMLQSVANIGIALVGGGLGLVYMNHKRSKLQRV